jgi:hypothetical protein
MNINIIIILVFIGLLAVGSLNILYPIRAIESKDNIYYLMLFITIPATIFLWLVLWRLI